MTFKLLPIIVALAVCTVTLPVRAADDDSDRPGLTYASLFSPVPAGTPINVRPWDNTTDNQRVKMSFTEALHRRGVPVTDGKANLTLNFETNIDSLAIPGAGSGVGQIQHRDRDSRIRMTLGSGSDAALLSARGAATIRYILKATLDDQQSGERLWQGEATYTGAVSDEAGAFAAMAPILVDGFGQNVRPKTFRIQ